MNTKKGTVQTYKDKLDSLKSKVTLTTAFYFTWLELVFFNTSSCNSVALILPTSTESHLQANKILKHWCY